MISADQALRHLMGVWVLAGLATIFFCIVVTPVLIVIGFAGKFQSMWGACRLAPFSDQLRPRGFYGAGHDLHLDYDHDRIGVNATEVEAAGVRRIGELRRDKVDRGESIDLTAMSDVRERFW